MTGLPCTCHPDDALNCRENVYYSPEHFRLTSVGEIAASDGGYEFDTFAIWTDPATGEYLWADDSGCSCPTPFEDVECKRGTARDVMIDLDAWIDADYSQGQRAREVHRLRDAPWMRALVERAGVYR